MYGNTAERKSIEKAVEIAREIRARERFNKIDFYDPYPYQKKLLILTFSQIGKKLNFRQKALIEA